MATKTKKSKDLQPKNSGKVTGGRKGAGAQENLTLVRAAKPKVDKDLSPKKSPRGGRINKHAD